MTDTNNNVFTGERIRRATAMSNAHRRWWLAIAVALVGVLVMSWAALAVWSKSDNFETLAVKSLSDQTEVVALGSSHVYMMTNPASFDRPLMNLASDACNYECMEAVLHGNLARVPNLRAVVIELDIVPLIYDTIGVYKGDNTRLLDLQPSLADLHQPWPRKARLYWQRCCEYSPLTGPLISRNKFAPRTILTRLKYGQHNADEQNLAGHRMSEQVMTAEKDGDDRILVHSTEGSLEQVDQSIETLCRLIEFARGRGLRVILVRYPHHHTYWEQQPSGWDAAVDRAVAAVHKRFTASEVAVWDFGSSPAFADDEFHDGDHLNSRGTAKLNQIMNAKLNKLLALPKQ